MESVNFTDGFFKVLRWGAISREINGYLADIDASNDLRDLYRSFVNFALSGYGNGLLDEINLYEDIVMTEGNPTDSLTEVVVTLGEYREKYGKYASRVEDAVVDFTNYYSDKYDIPNPYFMLKNDEDKKAENVISEVMLPSKIELEKKKSTSVTKKNQGVKTSKREQFLFDLKKQVFNYQTRLNNGESLPDMIDEVLDSENVVMALEGNNDSKVMNDINFYYPVNGDISQLEPYTDNSKIENKLVVLYAGYSISVKPINMDTEKTYSISRDNPCVLKSFERLNKYARVFKKELGFPSHVCK